MMQYHYSTTKLLRSRFLQTRWRRDSCPKDCWQKTRVLMPASRSKKLQKLATPKDKRDKNMVGSKLLLAEMKRIQVCLCEISVNQERQRISSSSTKNKCTESSQHQNLQPWLPECEESDCCPHQI